ncbi:ABC transporter substrate-binding protein [Herbidospora daliensis]|uniref:ABC transporter substrate-binding protein n=1 Tax=Herbidospora daliensis TaxID=295585 RepID=UPI0009FCDC71|nr:ABC transporter substrate-binding protein [Herbidospora daliensis]
MRRLALVALLLVSACRVTSAEVVVGGPPACAGQHADGLTPTTVRVGGVYPLSGPASAYGAVAQGAAAYFAWANARGGVAGRQVEFLVRDDGYQPARAVEEARRLVDSDRVFALFQTLGTPSTAAVRAYADRRGVPQPFVASGASDWGDAAHPWTIGFQPTYAAEARVYARHLLRTRPHATVAVLYQNDDFGRELLTAFEDAVAGTGVQVVARRGYEVMDADVQAQMAGLAASGAGVFLNVGTPKFAAQALAADAAMTTWNPLHLLNGVANTPSLVAGVGPAALRGVLTTGFYKDPVAWEDDPDVRTFAAAVRRHVPDADPASSQVMFGWTSAAAFAAALERMECPSREGLMAAARDLRDVEIGTLLPGITVSTGPGDPYPVEDLRVFRFGDSGWEAV